MLLSIKMLKPQKKDFILYTVNGKEYIGRVIADEGKSVTAMDDFLYVNDKSVDEAYISKGKSAYLATVSPGNFFTDDFSIATLTDNKQTKIEKGQYLVLNDNRRIQMIVVSLVSLKKTKLKVLSLSDCILYHVLVSLMSINISILLKKLGTFDKFLAFFANKLVKVYFKTL